MALHAKAKAEAGHPFYALYDKISREDILSFAYAQCRSNKGAPGADEQDFTDIEAYGVERWLAELALALKEETYRADLSTLAPLWSLWIDLTECTRAQRGVGEGVKSCPRAGCGKSARPVR
jgi:hypothetical protein